MHNFPLVNYAFFPDLLIINVIDFSNLFNVCILAHHFYQQTTNSKFMLLNILLFFQNTGALANEVVDAAAEIKKESFLDIILHSSPFGIAVVVTLLLMSIYSAYIIVERYLTLGKASEVDNNFMSSIRNHVKSDNMGAALALCQSVDAPMARMVQKGLQRIGKPLDDINSAIENVGNIELLKLEKNLSSLASIAGIAPMIGLLGTVVGMIISFRDMAGATQVTPQVISNGIYHALTATGFGLMVSIVALAGYNLLVARLDKVIFKMETTTMDFIDLLQEP
jgi:biopolymer transport protein ExbB